MQGNDGESKVGILDDRARVFVYRAWRDNYHVSTDSSMVCRGRTYRSGYRNANDGQPHAKIWQTSGSYTRLDLLGGVRVEF